MKAQNITVLVAIPPVNSSQTQCIDTRDLLTLTAVLQNLLAGEYNTDETGRAKKVPISFYGMPGSSSQTVNVFYLKPEERPLEAGCFNVHHRYVTENNSRLILGAVAVTFKLYSATSEQVYYLDIGAEVGRNSPALTYFFRETVDQGS